MDDNIEIENTRTSNMDDTIKMKNMIIQHEWQYQNWKTLYWNTRVS